jgi:Mn2+/Fe2+ NRAMP family transporter
MTRDLGKRATGKLREANFYFAIESGLALATSYFINLAIVVVFATVFYKPDMPADTPLPGLYDAATVLMETLGESSKYLWAIGLLAAGQSSVFASTLAGQ